MEELQYVINNEKHTEQNNRRRFGWENRSPALLMGKIQSAQAGDQRNIIWNKGQGNTKRGRRLED